MQPLKYDLFVAYYHKVMSAAEVDIIETHAKDYR
jgi:hypothetical protein